MIRRPPRTTLDRSSASSDVYKRQQRESSRKNISRKDAKNAKLRKLLSLAFFASLRETSFLSTTDDDLTTVVARVGAGAAVGHHALGQRLELVVG